MKASLLFVLSISFGIQLFSQTISGKVLNSSDGEPLIYASIGVIGTSRGTITDEQGNFCLDIKDIPVNSTMRFSMIGFNPVTSLVSELVDKQNAIFLEPGTVQLAEIIVKPAGKPKIVGTTDYTRGTLCGWGGTDTGKGYEIGTKLELGPTPVRLRSLHLHIHKQSFDSTLFRLHIRDLIDEMPGNELLNSDILFTADKESGWIEVDLSKYNLVFKDTIVLSLEWIKVTGLNNDSLMKMDGQKQYTANVLLSKKMNHGCMFTRWGSEAKWTSYDNSSPSFYLTVQ